MLSVLSALLFVGCTESSHKIDSSGYGYAQFQLLKDSYSRAETDNLDFLGDAKKIRVTLASDGSTITQTLLLAAYNPENAEYGLRSDKLELLVGEYQIKNFVIYDNLDEILYSEYECDQIVTVTDGGLSVTALSLSATNYGNVTFSFSKKFVGADAAATKAGSFQFSYVGKVTLKLVDEYKIGYTIEDIPVKYTVDYSRDENGEVYQAALLSSTKSYRIPSKEWRVESYTLKTPLNAWVANSPSSDIIDCNFEINDDYRQSIDIPLVVSTEDIRIQDYRALKAIWEALGGENWSYQGKYLTKGTNWDFNKDIDMWGEQPGVTINSNGRITSIDVSDFGARGYVPAELGQLTELTALSIGTHNDTSGGSFDDRDPAAVAATLSPEIRLAYTEAGVALPGGFTLAELEAYEAKKAESAPSTRADVSSGLITSDVTSIPKEIAGLTKIQSLYIANTTMATLPDELSLLTDLSTLEIYNLPNMTQAPAVFEHLPASLISINISENPQLEAAEILSLFEMLSASPAASSIQLLYSNNNSLEILPACLGNMTKLALLQVTSNNIKTVESMPTLRPTDVNLGGNKIKIIPDDFCNTDDIESFSADYNQLEEFPNIFNAKQIPISTVSLSHNKIKAMPSDFKGLNTETLNLSHNYFEEYPAAFATTNSAISSINMSYNKLTKFAEGCFKYDNSSNLTSLDFQFNHLEKLPAEFWGNNLPFLYGLDLSYNRFDHFPYNALYSPMLTVFIFRGQRDGDGNRIMKEWPLGVYKHTGLRALFLGSNDIRQVDDTISFLINTLDISDNPNISIDMSAVCNYIQAGMYMLYYDKTQDIRQCPILGITK